jgi:hypothetical protein
MKIKLLNGSHLALTYLALGRLDDDSMLAVTRALAVFLGFA